MVDGNLYRLIVLYAAGDTPREFVTSNQFNALHQFISEVNLNRAGVWLYVNEDLAISATAEEVAALSSLGIPELAEFIGRQLMTGLVADLRGEVQSKRGKRIGNPFAFLSSL